MCSGFSKIALAAFFERESINVIKDETNLSKVMWQNLRGHFNKAPNYFL